MAEERQPQNVVEGAVGDVEDEVPAAKSAEDRKAADALSKLDNRADDDAAGGSKDVDQDAVNRALGGGKTDAKKDTKKVKIDTADVTLIMSELDVTKPQATSLLKASNGDAVQLLKDYVTPNAGSGGLGDSPRGTFWERPITDTKLQTTRATPRHAATLQYA
ncbi:hypothetical protein DL546_008374 [Coniochaeta pulveracea]|uniref:Nascent polypeptide-associated complex subunit alpha-like UBA domain-containing protein n=1 Tax=Coniochaeta pulveracea TaxID=177199 RepID=A0A420YKB7_9PEZI|nr:hypothetical protein DL546_008374 [Coniochaeta pulveracea]